MAPTCKTREEFAHKGTGHSHHTAGFTLLELVGVLAVCLILGAVAVLNVRTTTQVVHLRGSGTEYANLLQNARIRAIRDDTFYAVRADTTVNPPRAFVDVAGTGLYANGDPLMVFASDVTPMPFASGPGLANLKSQFLPANGQGTVNTAQPGPTFGPRGLPCAPNGGTCPYLPPTSYITFVQNPQSGKWEAITVNPAGRIRVWSYEGTTWSPLN